MLGLIGMVAFLALVPAQDVPPQAAPLSPRIAGTAWGECMVPLGRRVVDRAVPMRCTVGEGGQLRDCQAGLETGATWRERRVAICLAEHYAVDEGHLGEAVDFTIYLKANLPSPWPVPAG